MTAQGTTPNPLDGAALTPPEKSRTYTYPDGQRIELSNVTHLRVSESGNHYLIANKRKHIVAPGWRHIQINVPEWTL